jgi:hypothetical protein
VISKINPEEPIFSGVNIEIPNLSTPFYGGDYVNPEKWDGRAEGKKHRPVMVFDLIFG